MENWFSKLVCAERYFSTIEIMEKSTGKTGVANTYCDGVAVFYGDDDGSDDDIITSEEFNERFRITGFIK